MVNIGIIIKFATIEMTFNVLKKKAIISIKDKVELKLSAMLDATFLLNLPLISALYIGLYNIAIPKTQLKLIKKLTSKTHSGFIAYIIIPAKDIEQKISYSSPKTSESIKTIAIMLALKIDVAKLHMYI